MESNYFSDARGSRDVLKRVTVRDAKAAVSNVAIGRISGLFAEQFEDDEDQDSAAEAAAAEKVEESPASGGKHWNLVKHHGELRWMKRAIA